MIYPGRRGLQSPAQMVPEARVNMAMRGWPRLDGNDPINQGLVGCWSMDGGTISGTTLADLSGSGNNGTLSGAPTLVNGVIGQALAFNGTNQKVTIAHNAALGSGSAITVSAWVYLNDTSSRQRVMNKWDGNWGWILELGSGQWTFWCSANTEFVNVGTATGVDLHKWHLITGTYDGANVNIFVDGVLKGSNAQTGALHGNVNSLNIGADEGGTLLWLNGSVDDARVLTNHAFSPAEELRHYNDTSGNLGLIVPTRRIVGATAVVSTAKFRRTLSPLGTRIGSRQAA